MGDGTGNVEGAPGQRVLGPKRLEAADHIGKKTDFRMRKVKI